MKKTIFNSFYRSGLLWCLCLYATASQAAPIVELPAHAFTPAEIAIIVNDDDALSVKIGEYYRKQRGIPHDNLIHVNFKPGFSNMEVAVFNRIKARVDEKTPTTVQAYVLTWLKPYRVTCMSITSAFAFRFNLEYCAQGCKKTKPSPYFNSASVAPYTDYGLRPTMILAATDFAAAKRLMQRGIDADNTAPTGTAYLMDTNDKNRNVRSQLYDHAIKFTQDIIKVKRIKGQALKNKKDVLFYFTGLVRVPAIESNRFLPGAIADHLTSTGGQLTDSKQMSILQWIKAGATGSYGTVVEPCNWQQKFPHPSVVMDRYTSGETLIEAYWKSVKMPGQGLFIGEPLARPYGGYRWINKAGRKYLRVWSLHRGRYIISGADVADGVYQPLGQIQIELSGRQDIEFKKNWQKSFIRLQKTNAGG
ncbi:MAG: TIGR03790 family protein [Thiohalomonadales bacterium]